MGVCSSLNVCDFRLRQGDGEGRAAGGGGGDGDRAAVEGDDGVDEGETESEARGVAGFVRAIEALEDVGAFFRRHADACVGDCEVEVGG